MRTEPFYLSACFKNRNSVNFLKGFYKDIIYFFIGKLSTGGEYLGLRRFWWET